MDDDNDGRISKQEFFEYCSKNKKRGNIFPDDVRPVAAMWADPWEMMLFDNNSAHSVEEFLPGGTRIALIIGFINISHDDLIDYYQRWTDVVQN